MTFVVNRQEKWVSVSKTCPIDGIPYNFGYRFDPRGMGEPKIYGAIEACKKHISRDIRLKQEESRGTK